MSEKIEDEEKILNVLNEAHDEGKIVLSFQEIVKASKIPQARVKAALMVLIAKGIVSSRDINITSIYYVKNRIKIEGKR